jgi:hypothetical protein
MSIRPISNSLSIRTSQPAPAPSQAAAPASAANNSRSDLLRARDELLRVYDALQGLAELANVRTSFNLDLPDARSASSINLDLTSSAATLASSQQINASPRSFTPFGPAWNGASSALLTIGGEYDGSHGSGALTFEVRRPGVHGADNLRIRAYDPNGVSINNYNVRASDAPDRQYDIGNGLFFTVGDGLLIDNDTAAIQISDTVGSVFDPARPFNGVRNSNPNFQYYETNPLDPVVDGSFLLNGEVITVNASDNMNDVIARINQSAAGVTATYNIGSEQVEFTQKTKGSAATIAIQGDTSNLIAASKLSGATVVAGIDPDSEKALRDVAALSSVQSGSVYINNTAIAIDAATDSLTTVIQKINSADAGVTASFDQATRKVLIASNESPTFEIDSNGTNFFSALNIADGRVDGQVTGISKRRAYAIADKIEDVFESLNKLFSDKSFTDGSDHTGVFRNVLASAVNDTFGRSTDRSDALYGISFDRSKLARRRGYFAGFDRQDFTQGLQRRGNDVGRLLAGSSSTDGLVNDLGQATVAALRNINSALGLSGSFVDVFA